MDAAGDVAAPSSPCRSWVICGPPSRCCRGRVAEAQEVPDTDTLLHVCEDLDGKLPDKALSSSSRRLQSQDDVLEHTLSGFHRQVSKNSNSSGSSTLRLTSMADLPSAAKQPLMRLLIDGASLQVCLGGQWTDLGPTELTQLVKQLRTGSQVCQVRMRESSYTVDFSNPEAPQHMSPQAPQASEMRWQFPPKPPPGIPEALSTGSPGTKARRDLKISRTRSQNWMLTELRKAASMDDCDTVARYELGSIKSLDSFKSEGSEGDSSDDEYERKIGLQEEYGAQSRRGRAPQDQLSVLDQNTHAQDCFQFLADNETELCGEWAVFYHAYSLAALLYEVHAAIAASLFGFRSEFSSLPRILVHEFARFPDAESLIERFKKEYAKGKMDHEAEYRRVAISAMCSLVALGPEASTPVVFLAGYGEKDLSFAGVLENLLESCHVPKRSVKKLATEIVALSEKHGLDVSQFGGKPCQSGKAGHLLQIFIRRDLVDMLAYAAKPYGALDKARHPISGWLNGDTNTNFGQARIVAHPLWFMQATCVQMHVASADPRFHQNRKRFQEELTGLLGGILGEPQLRESSANGIFGGEVPDWFSSMKATRTWGSHDTGDIM